MPEDSFSEPPRKRLRSHTWENSAESQKVPVHARIGKGNTALRAGTLPLLSCIAAPTTIHDRPSCREDFRIAIVCALPVEYDTVFLLFDEVWDENGEQFGRARGDTNHYTTGRIGEHDVVLALLPDIGKAPAAGAAASIRSSYPNLRVALLVGICGGVPKVGLNELLLGDVVIAEMVVRYDFGRQYHDTFVPKDTADHCLGRPNKDIRSLIAMVRSETGKERIKQSAIKHLVCLQKAAISKQRSCDYRYPGFAEDRLFLSTYRHKHRGPPLCVSCNGEDQKYCADAVKAFCEELVCDETQLEPRSRLERKRNLEPEAAQPPEIFVGRIASGDTVMKSSEHRDKIAREHNVIAFEMEGAGVWDEIPCIVIKGISDYADSHKSKVWQPFAAATAAAVAKAVLERYTRSDNCYSSTINSDLKERNRKYLKDLRITDPRHDKMRIEQTKDDFLTGLHRWILDNAEFQRWHDDEQSRLLWIKGDPGKGKTMLLCGIINELEPHYHLSFFFCQASDARVNNATAVLRGLIYLLVDQQPSLISHVQKKYDAEGDPLFRDVNAWVAMSEILNGILQDPTLLPTRFIIDALDECIEGLDLLLGLVVRTSSVYAGVKWIVSSRNWPVIEKILATATQKVKLSLELNEKSVSTAVTTYIQSKVDWLVERNRYSNDTRDTVERYLSTNAYGTFLWVALVCRELADASEWEVEELLRTFPPGLDALYRRMIDHINNSRHAHLLKRLLAAAAVIYRPLTLEELPALVDIPNRASGNIEALAEIVGLCGSFLTLRERTISFVHQSAKDFLLNQARDDVYPFGIEEVHYTIFSRSLKVIQEKLRRDIYTLGHPGFSIDKVISPDPDPLAAVRYSCVYWVNHLRDCDPKKNASEDLQDGGSIDIFLRQKYLYWLEALSLLRSIPEGIASVLQLERVVKEGTKASHLNGRVRDICRFSLYHKWAIENSPLQVYTSALIFSPTCSITRNQYEDMVPKWIIRKPIMTNNWTACLQTLEGHGKSVSAVAWSHDSARLASASDDETVKIWDPATGQCVSTLEGHGGWVNAVAWSHDSTRLASASSDKTVKIWDPATGQCVSTLGGHGDMVNAVAWSHDSTRLASASYDKTVKIWDPATGQCVSTLEGQGDWVYAAVWSHDSTRLASASSDKTVKIWDPATGQCISTLEGHGDWVNAVAWSHDSTRLASASSDKTVKIWAPATGQCVSTIPIGASIENLQFHKSNPNVLHTERGIFDFRHVVDLTLGPVSADCLSPEVVGYGLSSNNTWITYQGENLIWLPSEYRPSASAVSGTRVSIGCSSGRVLFIEFSEWGPTL